MFLVFPIFGSVSYNDKGLLKVEAFSLIKYFPPGRGRATEYMAEWADCSRQPPQTWCEVRGEKSQELVLFSCLTHEQNRYNVYRLEYSVCTECININNGYGE